LRLSAKAARGARFVEKAPVEVEEQVFDILYAMNKELGT